jgi:muramoyltetrapeptide carboxypeptidase LdcA involved in peptidoglycan recycling
MSITKPARLKTGDTVAVLSPSAGLPNLFPHVYEHGLMRLRDTFGLRVKAMPTAMLDDDTLYRDPKRRAEDINAAFADREVKAIISTIGGDDSVRILEYLDLDVIKDNPKIIMGYSDATTFLTYLNQQGLVTFHGPAIMAGFSQLKSLPSIFEEHIRAVLMSNFESYTYQPYGVYTEGYPDWGDPANVGKVEPLQADRLGWQWVQGEGRSTGRLFGGCIEVLEFMKGTRYWPAPDFWDDKILFFETSEEVPSIEVVKRFLRNYGTQGIFKRIQGMLFGRARDYSAEQKIALTEMIRALLTVEFDRPDLPVVANLDFGHTDPQWILPNGAQVEIDCSARIIRLVECPTM